MPVTAQQIKIRRRDPSRLGHPRPAFPFKTFFVILLALGGYWGYHRFINPPHPPPSKRLIILAFEGADPKFIDKYWGDLPNLKRLVKQGFRGELATVSPPEPPVCWASFAVGANPGVHGIFSGFRRPWGTYSLSPDGYVRIEGPKFFWGHIPVRAPKIFSTRGGRAFWDVTAKHKIPTVLLRVPGTFPAPKNDYTTTLCGLGVPDLCGTQGVFHHFSTRYKGKVRESMGGGKLAPLVPDGDWYRGVVIGPPNPVLKDRVNRLKEKRFATRLKQMETRLALWLLDRTSISLLSDRDRYLQTLIEMGAELRSGTRSMLKKHLDTVRRLQAILTEPDGPQATALLSKVRYSPKAKLSEYIKEEENLAEHEKQLEEKPGVVRSVTAAIAFSPVDENMTLVSFGREMDRILLGKWSDWFDITFPLTWLFKIHGVTRFYVESISPELEVFMQPIEIDPRHPYLPISHPARFARELAESDEVGLFKTRGWAAESGGWEDGKLDKKAFLEDLTEVEREQEAITFYAYENKKFNLFVSVFPGIDWVTRMMYRRSEPTHAGFVPDRVDDPIKPFYLQMDRVVGRMLDRIERDKNTLLFIISDHGFRSFRYRVNLNTWLVKEGYMTLKEPETQPSQDLAFVEQVDWSKTKAYSLGCGQIYINLQGREPHGTVDPSNYEDLCSEIRANLVKLTDQREGHFGENVVRTVGLGEEIWKGEFSQVMGDRPDIQVGFEAGYAATKQSIRSLIAANIIEENEGLPSGEFRSVSTDLVPGVLFCNKGSLRVTDPSILDLAPTILAYFDLPIPATMEGRNLLAPFPISVSPSQ